MGKKALQQDIAAALIPDALLTVETVATVCGVGVSTIYEWVRARTFPAPQRYGRKMTRWKAATVMQWLREREAAAL